MKKENRGEGYHAIGWRLDARYMFSRKALLNWLVTLKEVRLKAVMITDEGVFGYNLDDTNFNEMELDDCEENRIEIIATSLPDELEQQLMGCLEN